jgi:signal transduction histidine kinase
VRRIALALVLVAGCRPHASWSFAPPPVALSSWEYCWADTPSPPDCAWQPLLVQGAPPDREGRARAWFRIRLPAPDFDGPALFLEDVETTFEAWQGGAPIYRWEWEGRRPRVPHGSPWHLIGLSRGELVYLHVESESPIDIGPVGRALLGSRADLILRLVSDGLEVTAVGLLCLFLGFLGILTWARRRIERHYFWFGLFVASSGMTLLATSQVKQLFWNAPVAWQWLLLLGRLVGPASLCAFVDEMSMRRHAWLGRFWRGVLVFGALFTAAVAIDWTRVYAVGWRLLNLEFFSCYAVATWVAVRAALRGEGEAKIFSVGIAVYGIAAVRDALVALHVIPGDRPWSPFGFLVFAATLGAIQLARFAALHEALQRHVEELERKNVALEKAQRDLERALAVRDEFLSIASHELRTPLTSLQLQVQLLGRREHGPGLQIIARQADRLGQLTDSLLDVSRVQGGRLELRREQVDLALVAREVAARMHDDASRAGCSLEVVSPQSLIGQWDRLRLEQVITNLVSNALKYGAGQPVRIALEQLAGVAVLTVKDGGIGIPRDSQRRIFERFERAVSSHNYPGLGLGLWITREIVIALGGAIAVESTPGQGATFRVELPLASEASTPAPSPDPR